MQLEAARPKGKRLLCALRLLQGWDTDACTRASYRPHGTATAGLQWYHGRTHQHGCGLSGGSSDGDRRVDLCWTLQRCSSLIMIRIIERHARQRGAV